MMTRNNPSPRLKTARQRIGTELSRLTPDTPWISWDNFTRKCKVANKTFVTYFPELKEQFFEWRKTVPYQCQRGYIATTDYTAIRDVMVKALKIGPLNLDGALTVLKWRASTLPVRGQKRAAINRALSKADVHYYQRRVTANSPIEARWSLEPLDDPWGAELATVCPRQAVAPEPVEELQIEGGKIVGKIVRYHDQPPMTVRYMVPRKMAG